MRPLLRARSRRARRALAGLAARPARAGRHPLDQQRRRPHELRDDRDGAAEPRVRPRQGARRPAASCAGRARARRWRPSTAWSARCRPAWASSRAAAASRRWPSPASWAGRRARSPTRRSVVALEAAWWEPLAVRRGARAMAMHTEASHRFERGADIGAGPRALARLAHLLQKIGGGQRPSRRDRTAWVTAARAAERAPATGAGEQRCSASTCPVERQTAILAVARLRRGRRRAGELVVGVPSWRLDVSREADLAEEVGASLRRQPRPDAPSRRRPGPGRLRRRSSASGGSARC